VNLADWLRRPGRPAEQISLVAALAQAVEEGHQSGRQYSGWSPSRVQIRSDGGVDLSQLEGSTSEDLSYSAPESADGSGHSARSDVYSAGVVLYEILAGSHPFGGVSVKQPRGAARPLSEVRKDLSKDLADAVTACLERDPDWRPQDLSYVLQVARQLGGKPTPAPAAPAVSSGGASSARPSTGRYRSPDAGPSFGSRSASAGKPSRLPIVIAGVVILLAGGVAVWTLKGGGFIGGGGQAARTDPTPPPATPTTPTVETAAPTAAVAVPSAASAKPTAATAAPAPSVAAPPSPAAVTSAPPPARPIAIAAATAPVVTSAPTAPPKVETAVPIATDPPPPPAEPAMLVSVAPPKLKQGQKALVDVRGDRIRAQHQVLIVRVKGKGDPGHVKVARTKVDSPTLLKVLLDVAPSANTGQYSLALVDERGASSNAVLFEVTE
jgi:serine/threonine-protein kinase